MSNITTLWEDRVWLDRKYGELTDAIGAKVMIGYDDSNKPEFIDAYFMINDGSSRVFIGVVDGDDTLSNIINVLTTLQAKVDEAKKLLDSSSQA